MRKLARGVTIGLATIAATAPALVVWADGPGRESSDPGLRVVQPADANKPAWMKKMEGSFVDFSTYVGSGSFYVSGYRDPYVALALYFRPTYDLGTRFKLSANARLYLEEELTLPDNPTGRRFNPYDIWLWVSAKELHYWERPKLKLGAVARIVLPVSWESRYSNLATGFGVGPNLSRVFDLGPKGAPIEKSWKLVVTLGSVFTKYIHSSELRGSFPGDTTGCRPFIGGAATPAGGMVAGAESDRCGGPVNTSFTLLTTGGVSVTRGKWSGGITLLVANSVRYHIPADQYTAINADDIGRNDTTWGIISLGYNINDHMGVSLGLSSFQNALDSRNRYLRFPFFDFSGANANNFTQVFAGLNGTL